MRWEKDFSLPTKTQSRSYRRVTANRRSLRIAEPAKRYRYRWDRIAAVLVLNLSMTLAAAGFGAWLPFFGVAAFLVMWGAR